MAENVKVGDVVRLTCNCANCQRFGPPDPNGSLGLYLVESVERGEIKVRKPFDSEHPPVFVGGNMIVTVVGRAE